MSLEIIQLTQRDPNKVWKTKSGEKIQMANMEDQQLQGALVACQKGKVKTFMSLMQYSKLEEQLKEEAKVRGFELKDLDYVKATFLGCKYGEFKETINSAIESIRRKAKKIVKEFHP